MNYVDTGRMHEAAVYNFKHPERNLTKVAKLAGYMAGAMIAGYVGSTVGAAMFTGGGAMGMLGPMIGEVIGESIWDALNGEDLGTSILMNAVGEAAFLGADQVVDFLRFAGKELAGEVVEEGIERAVKGTVSEAVEEAREQALKSADDIKLTSSVELDIAPTTSTLNLDSGFDATTGSGMKGGGGSCPIKNSFSADTLVATEDGGVPIVEIEIGDEVLAYNEANGEVGEYTVTATINHVDPEIVLIVIDGEYLETTREHPFYTDEGEWVDAEDLTVGEEIRNLDGEYGTVESLELIAVSQAMYNLTVETAHTFFVGEGEWLVHNCNGLSRPAGANSPDARTADYRDNLKEVWEIPSPQRRSDGTNIWEAHHIVAGDIAEAQAGRDVLDHYGIKVDSPANLVWLPGRDVDASITANYYNPAPLAHRGSGIHTYAPRSIQNVQRVNQILRAAKERGATKDEIIGILNTIGSGYQQGKLP